MPSFKEIAGAISAAALLVGAPVQAADIRLGVYDLEQVYQNYPGTEGLEQDMQAIQREAQSAQQEQNQQRLQELQQEAQELQQETLQRFQADVENASSQVAEDNNVAAIVVEVVHYGDDVELVDLTREVIDQLSNEE